MKLILSFVFILLCNVAQSDDLDVKATKLIQEFFLKSAAPGLSVSVGYDDKIIWSKGFGYADLEQKVTVDPSLTKFRVGSIAKPFTAFALAKLLDGKKIELDSEIQSYVPSFPKKKYPITIRQIAGHLSGIRHYQGNEFYSQKKYTSVLEGLAIFQADPLEHMPGDKWSYTSYGYNLLSAAVEQASGKSFLNYMNEDVFLPLGMKQTVPDYLDEIIINRGRYYLRRDNAYFNEPEVNNSYKWAGGGFLSTTDDLVRFGFAHLNDKHLSKSTIDLLWTSQQTADGALTGYGIGWRIVKLEGGQTWIGHGGGSVGGSTQFWLLKKHGLVIAMVSNMSALGYGDVLIKLGKLFITDEKR